MANAVPMLFQWHSSSAALRATLGCSASHPCKDHDGANDSAHCTDSTDGGGVLVDDYLCSCPTGWEGENCEVDTDECEATCIKVNANAVGSCALSANADGCTATGGLDASSDCTFAQVAFGAYDCACVDGFDGDTCEYSGTSDGELVRSSALAPASFAVLDFRVTTANPSLPPFPSGNKPNSRMRRITPHDSAHVSALACSRHDLWQLGSADGSVPRLQERPAA